MYFVIPSNTVEPQELVCWSVGGTSMLGYINIRIHHVGAQHVGVYEGDLYFTNLHTTHLHTTCTSYKHGNQLFFNANDYT